MTRAMGFFSVTVGVVEVTTLWVLKYSRAKVAPKGDSPHERKYF